MTVTIDHAAPRLDKALACAVPEGAALSRSRLMKMIAAGDVWRGGVPVTDAKARVAAGDVFTLRLAPPEDLDTLPEDIPLSVVYEDGDLIVIDKPAGMVVHPAPGSRNGTLVNALLHHCGDTLAGIGGARRPGIVHRIDKDTTGLLVVAKTDRAHHALSDQFADHSVTRRYLAVVHGAPSAYDPRIRGLQGVTFEGSGVLKIATQLARHKTDRQRQAVIWHSGRHAVTRTRVIAQYGPAAALVECWLETGRTHQIRVHLSYAGHGLIGDQTYGGSRKFSPKAYGAGAEGANAFPRQALHAASLGFDHPATGERMEFQSPLPADIAALLADLSGGATEGV
ncbi:MAG: RluA family pseudouridine synthase [Cypionkella sp.]|nr:RluA family pseudouridine synthase [Cypionkella sp.]